MLVATVALVLHDRVFMALGTSDASASREASVTSLALILPLLPLLGALIVLAAPEAEAISILIAVAVVTTAVALVVAASALA